VPRPKTLDVRARDQLPIALGQLAESQAGVFSREQLRLLDVSIGYDGYRVLVELDGRTGHEGVERFRDMNRGNQFALIEWITLRYGWFDVVHRPCLVAFYIAAALVVRGWSGLPTRCFRCVNVPDLNLCG
jgi:hypothetical protein